MSILPLYFEKLGRTLVFMLSLSELEAGTSSWASHAFMSVTLTLILFTFHFFNQFVVSLSLMFKQGFTPEGL